MRAGVAAALCRVLAGGLAGVLGLIGPSSVPSAGALDNQQFCSTMTEVARTAGVDVGRWVDRHTRDDGIEVVCEVRTVNYRRFDALGPLGRVADWKSRKQREWDSYACSSMVLRDAVEAGWNIVSTITAASGERTLVIATCRPTMR